MTPQRDSFRFTAVLIRVNRRKFIVAAALAIAAVGGLLILNLRPTPPPADGSGVMLAESGDAGEASSPALPPLRPLTTPVATGHKGTADSELPPEFIAPTGLLPDPWPESDYLPEEYEQGKIDIFYRFQRSTRDWTVETFAGKVAQVDELSGRDAYEVYAYLRACHRQPRNAQQMEQRLAQVRENNSGDGSGRRRGRRMSEDDMARYADGLRNGLVRCEALPPDEELLPMMMGWLTLAAERGFPQAQIAYHKSIRWLLALEPWGVYRYPQQVHDYRRLAPLFLEAALRSGHADVFNEYSIALRERVIFEEDPQAAFAYAHAATLASVDPHEEAESAMRALAAVLTPEQQRKAREMGRELCNEWCRGG